MISASQNLQRTKPFNNGQSHERNMQLYVGTWDTYVYQYLRINIYIHTYIL